MGRQVEGLSLPNRLDKDLQMSSFLYWNLKYSLHKVLKEHYHLSQCILRLPNLLHHLPNLLHHLPSLHHICRLHSQLRHRLPNLHRIRRLCSLPHHRLPSLHHIRRLHNQRTLYYRSRIQSHRLLLFPLSLPTRGLSGTAEEISYWITLMPT